MDIPASALGLGNALEHTAMWDHFGRMAGACPCACASPVYPNPQPSVPPGRGYGFDDQITELPLRIFSQEKSTVSKGIKNPTFPPGKLASPLVPAKLGSMF